MRHPKLLCILDELPDPPEVPKAEEHPDSVVEDNNHPQGIPPQGIPEDEPRFVRTPERIPLTINGQSIGIITEFSLHTAQPRQVYEIGGVSLTDVGPRQTTINLTAVVMNLPGLHETMLNNPDQILDNIRRVEPWGHMVGRPAFLTDISHARYGDDVQVNADFVIPTLYPTTIVPEVPRMPMRTTVERHVCPICGQETDFQHQHPLDDEGGDYPDEYDGS